MTACSRTATTRTKWIGALGLCSLLVAAAAAPATVDRSSCPLHVTAVKPGESIQAAVDHAGEGAAFCLKNGVHRAQVVRPKARQVFYGEGSTVLNGSQQLNGFKHEDHYWGGNSQFQTFHKN